jgi:hypothetical protein
MAKGCPTLGCGGDPNYAAPGKGHIPACKYPDVFAEIKKSSDAPMKDGMIEEQRTGEDK